MRKILEAIVLFVPCLTLEQGFADEMNGTNDSEYNYDCNANNMNSCYYTSGVWDHYKCVCLYPGDDPASQPDQNDVGYEEIIVIDDPMAVPDY